ncbi:Uncharacterized protein PHSC3_000526 [Chlamydiales bacterium STE3]|nr:Uncharacterized protein PHSC3_000526 [Chlamydiales bacterium STE3]
MLKMSNENYETESEKVFSSPLKIKKQKTEAFFERLWLLDRAQFNPKRHCMECLRVERTLQLIRDYQSMASKKVADLGCGYGIFAKALRDQGAKVDALDIASNALQHVKNEEHIKPIQDFVPYTHLEDGAYDLVLSTELIAYLPQEEYRLFFSELSRLVNKDGFVVCSTPLDIYSIDALDRFAALAETEFTIEKWVFSHHYLWIKLYRLIQAPHRFVKASKDKRYREEELSKKKGFAKWWFNVNSLVVSGFLWAPIKWLLHPFSILIEKNQHLLLCLEKFSRFVWQEQAISHALFIGKRKPLFETPPEERLPMERGTKKMIWE